LGLKGLRYFQNPKTSETKINVRFPKGRSLEFCSIAWAEMPTLAKWSPGVKQCSPRAPNFSVSDPMNAAFLSQCPEYQPPLRPKNVSFFIPCLGQILKYLPVYPV